jgi:hypothetical protein
MKTAFRFAWLGATLAIFVLPVVGQSTSASAQGSAAASPPVTAQTLQQRQESQQDRIAQGVKSGDLTAGEAANLESKEAKLNQEESAMKKVDDGHLTAAEKAKITQQQNRITQQIKQDERNAAKQPSNPVSAIDQREENQQDRIAQGVKSGALSAGQAAQLEKNQAKINNEVRKDRAANGGKLTAQEKAQINNQLNRQSHQIHQAMHGGGRR